MNCSEAKKISIEAYLASIGIHSSKEKNNSVWYNSPFRKENNPSFKVNRRDNVWYDFGAGIGGSILDLVMRMNTTGIAGALLILQKTEYSSYVRFNSKARVYDKSRELEVLEVQQLRNYALIDYLHSRNISYSTAKSFVKQVDYQVGDKEYFAIGFKNDKGGYELRNKYFKGSSSPKAVTTIKGFSKAVNVFEGFFDFLSALEYYAICKPANTTIILNSLSNVRSIKPYLGKFKRINLFLDNDEAGKRAANLILRQFSNVENMAPKLYADYKDFNDFWKDRD